MLIGIDASRALRARRTGTENYSLQLIRQLLSLSSGHRFRLYCDRVPPAGLFPGTGNHAAAAAGRGGSTESRAGQVELRVMPFPRLWTHLRLSTEVAAHPPDVLFVPSHVIPLVHPRRCVVTVHDLGFRFFPESHRPFDRWYLDWSTRFSARSAACVLADSSSTRDDLVRFYGIDPEGVRVIYLGRDESLAPVEDHAQRVDVLQRLGIWKDGRARPYVLYVGTLQPRKNLVRLVQAFGQALASYSNQLPGLQLVLAGQRGWLSEGLFRCVDELGLHGRVIFPGFVADDDLPALLTGAAVFAFPSLYEGFGLPVLEAQACGVPVLASNSSSIPEVAGDAALLVDPVDLAAITGGLVALLTDGSLREKLRQAGFANVRRFSWRRCAQETLAVLETCGVA